MGFEELGDDDLVRWLGGWIANVAGTIDFAAAGDTDSAGQITVSIHGDLVRLELYEVAAGISPERLSRAIEQGYVQAYREALHQVGMVFDRVEHDAADTPALMARIRKIREEYQDRDGLRRMLKRQAKHRESSWDPAADPLRRGI